MADLSTGLTLLQAGLEINPRSHAQGIWEPYTMQSQSSTKRPGDSTVQRMGDSGEGALNNDHHLLSARPCGRHWGHKSDTGPDSEKLPKSTQGHLLRSSDSTGGSADGTISVSEWLKLFQSSDVSTSHTGAHTGKPQSLPAHPPDPELKREVAWPQGPWPSDPQQRKAHCSFPKQTWPLLRHPAAQAEIIYRWLWARFQVHGGRGTFLEQGWKG
jgi:hypothetical protein